MYKQVLIPITKTQIYIQSPLSQYYGINFFWFDISEFLWYRFGSFAYLETEHFAYLCFQNSPSSVRMGQM